MRSAVLLVILGLIGCDSELFGSSCTAASCSDSLSLSLHTADNHWPDGDYRIELELTRDDQEVASLSQSVQYKESRPNGPDCEPLCRQATIEVQVD